MDTRYSGAMERGQAGWNLAQTAYYGIDTDDISNEELRSKPYFTKFREDGLTNTNPAIASAKAIMEPKVLFDLLSRGIPELTYAAGVGRLKSSLISNFDMNDILTSLPDWPEEGHCGDSADRWLHSDFKGVALIYNVLLFDYLITEGNLDEK